MTHQMTAAPGYYEARLNGIEDAAGEDDAVAYGLDYLESLTDVCAALRDEWRAAVQ